MNEISLHQYLLILSGGTVLLSLIAFLSLMRKTRLALISLLVLLPLSAGLLVLTQDVYSYRNLAQEQKVARVVVTLEQVAGPHHDQARYLISVDVPGHEARHFAMTGDQWQLEARVLRWQLPFAQLGMANLVRVERLANRYADIALQRQADKLYYQLPSDSLVDTWPVLNQAEFLRRWVEVDFGSAVFAPLADGAAYGVYLGRSGLFLKAENPLAKQALSDWSAR